MELTVWLIFDLGLKGDYEGLYYWLDSHKARECSNNTAVIKFPPSMSLNLLAFGLENAIKNDISKSVKIGERDRIYMIYKQGEKIKGKFIIGKRKPAPWAGYAPLEAEDAVDEG